MAATSTGDGRLRWPSGGGAAAGDGKRRGGMIGTLGKRRAGERRWGGPIWSSALDVCVQNILQHFGTYKIEVNKDE